MEEAALEGFRGGFAARRAPLEFGEEQWAKLYGFVIEDGAVLRSQWPLQRLEGIAEVSTFGVYQGPTETPYIVAVTKAGDVKWRPAPPDNVELGSAELSESWHDLLTEGDTPTAVTVNPAVRPITTLPLSAGELEHAAGGLVPALMLNSIEIADNEDVWFVYEDVNASTDAERLRAMTLGDDNKWPVDDDTEASPKAQHGVLWSGVLVLGDIEWNADPEQALSSSNKTRYRNGLWMSVPGEPLLFDPLSVLFIGEPSTHITGLSATNHGLLVFTNSAQGRGGVHLLRGTPDAFALEPLQVGLGVTEGIARWTDTSTDCWINASGEIWQTDTDSVRRLDRQGLGTDRQNPDQDGVHPFGPWLIAVRERQMFALRALDDGGTAAWTQLNVEPLGLPDLRYAAESGQSLYFLISGSIARFTRADTRTGVSDRGQTSAGPIDLAVASRTLATGKGHHKTFWHRVGVRATGGRRSTQAQVEKLILRAGPARDLLSPALERVGPWALSVEGPDEVGTWRDPIATWDGDEITWDGQVVRWIETLLPLPTHAQKRWQALVRGIGASNEFSIEVIFSGDVQVEQLGIFFRGSILGGDEEGR